MAFSSHIAKRRLETDARANKMMSILKLTTSHNLVKGLARNLV